MTSSRTAGPSALRRGTGRGSGAMHAELLYSAARAATVAVSLVGIVGAGSEVTRDAGAGPMLAHVALLVSTPIPVLLAARFSSPRSARILALAVSLVDLAFFAAYNASYHGVRGAGTVVGVFVLAEAPLRFGLAGGVVGGAGTLAVALRWPQLDVIGHALRTGSAVRVVVVLTVIAVVARALVRRSNAHVRAAQEQFEVAFHKVPTGLAVLDGDGRLLRANPALATLLPLSDPTVPARLATLFPPASAATLAQAMRAVLKEGAPGQRVELRLPDPAAERWVVAVFTPLRGEGSRGPRRPRLLIQFEDITEQRAVERRLIDETTRDVLTGLGNRAVLVGALEHSVRTGAIARSALLFVDIDRLKWVNDTLGHSLGDAFLVEVARRLRALVRPADLVTRVGGDEFVILCSEMTRLDDALEVATRAVETVREPMLLDGVEVHAAASVGVSVGIALGGCAGDSPQSRITDADAAMYQAKQAGGNRVALFTPPMRRARERHAQIDGALREDLHADRLRLHYQPIVNLRTGGFDGVEALLRWPGHDENIEAAIAVAEESELIVTLGEWVLSRALHQHPGGLLAVNVSVRQLVRPRFTASVLRLLDGAGVEPGRLCLEVTETSLAENVDAVVTALSELRAAGVQLAIDDFGTGHASLTYLAKFPVDVVKVDRSFVHGLGNDAASGVIVRSVVAMAHALGMTVIAEGVENLKQLEIVLEAGCDAAQGYLFSRPVPRQQCAETLSNAVPWPVGYSGRRPSPGLSRPGGPAIEPARRYRLLLDLARDITGRLDRQEVLDASFVALRQLITFGGGSIQLVDGDGVRLAAADPPATPEAYETRIPLGQGIGGRIVVSGEPRYIPDILTDPEVPAWRATSSGVRSYFGVPLITEGSVLGVLQIDSPDVDPFSEEDRFTILAFTPIVAAALQNARLFEREAAQALVPQPRLPRPVDAAYPLERSDP